MRLVSAALLFVSTLIVALPAGAAKPEPDPLLTQVTRVYLLTMTGGMDQYLANQLTTKHLFEVVTDPKLADAVMTEAIGPAFEARLLELLPPPPPPTAAPPPPVKQRGKGSEPEAQGLVGGGVPLRTASMGHGRGNLFLVELKTRRVIWSIYRLPKNRTSVELDRTSAQVAEDLTHNLGKK